MMCFSVMALACENSVAVFVNNMLQGPTHWVAFSFTVINLLFCCPRRTPLVAICSWAASGCEKKARHTCTFPPVHSSPWAGPDSWVHSCSTRSHTWGLVKWQVRIKPALKPSWQKNPPVPLKDSVQWTSITLELLQWKGIGGGGGGGKKEKKNTKCTTTEKHTTEIAKRSQK